MKDKGSSVFAKKRSQAVTKQPRLGFFVFEMCVGLYFPMMGTMKGQIVPEPSP